LDLGFAASIAGGQIFLPTYAVLPPLYEPNKTGGSRQKTVPCPTDVNSPYDNAYSSGVLVYGFQQ